MAFSATQATYLRVLADQPGPVAAQDAFGRFRMSKLSIGRLLEGEYLEKEMIDGRSHYRLTALGVRAIAQAA